jgi:hypothetical protein
MSLHTPALYANMTRLGACPSFFSATRSRDTSAVDQLELRDVIDAVARDVASRRAGRGTDKTECPVSGMGDPKGVAG